MKNKHWLRWALPLLFVAAALAVTALLAGYTRSTGDKLYLTPLLSDANGWELYGMENGQARPLTPEEVLNYPDTVYLKRVLDLEWERTGYTFLELDAYADEVNVFLEDEPLYHARKGGERPRGESLRVALPGGWGGKTLTVAVRQETGAGMPMVILSSGAVETSLTLALGNKLAMLCAAYAVAAVLLLGLALFGAYHGRWDWPTLLLAVAAFGQALYWLREYDMRFSGHFALDVPLAAFLPHLFVLLPLVYLAAQTRRRRKWCFLAVGFAGAASLLSVICAPLSFGAEWFYTGLYVGTLAVLVFGALEAKEGNRVFGLFFSGLGVLLGAVGVCVLLSLLGDGTLAGNVATVLSSVPRGSHAPLLHWVGLGLFLLCALLSVFQALWWVAQTRAQVELLSSRNALAQENLRILQENSEALAKTRHDMAGHLNTLQTLVGQGEYQRAEEYLQSLTRQVGAIVPVRLAAHAVVNAILLQYAQRAKGLGVRFECHAELPEALPVPDSDLSALLTNLLSNALAAAQKIGGWVEFTIHIRGKYLFVECRNSYEGKLTQDAETGLYLSGQGPGHGWGMKIMEDIAHRYQGELQAEGKDGVFLARTALNLDTKP